MGFTVQLVHSTKFPDLIRLVAVTLYVELIFNENIRLRLFDIDAVHSFELANLLLLRLQYLCDLKIGPISKVQKPKKREDYDSVVKIYSKGGPQRRVCTIFTSSFTFQFYFQLHFSDIQSSTDQWLEQAVSSATQV